MLSLERRLSALLLAVLLFSVLLVDTILPNVRGLESLDQDALPVGAPLFTSDDINIPGLALDLNTSIAQYNPPVYISPYDWELLQAVYTRNDIYHSESYAYIVLNIYYFDIVEYAKNKFNETWQEQEHNSELYQDYTYLGEYPTIIESEFSTNYGSLITSQNVGSAENPEYLRSGNRAIYGADPSYSGDSHIAILISATGKAFTSDGEIRAQMDIVTQHARNLVLNTPRKTAAPSITPTMSASPTPSGASPSASPSASPTQTQRTGEEFEVMWFEGTVQVQRADSTAWIPATIGMLLREGDQIRTVGNPQNNRVLLHYAGSAQGYYGGTDVRVAGDSSLTVKNYSETHPPGDLLRDVWGIITLIGIAIDHGLVSIWANLSAALSPSVLVETPDSWIHEEGTEFEIIVNSQGTSVYTFEGAVRVYDFNGSSNLLVGENKTCTVQKATGVSIPTYFNPEAVDQWWTSFPASSTLGASDSGIFTYLIIAVIVIVIVVVAVGVFAVSRRKKTRLPPPPPPPPPP